ncbi:MAG: M23 family metallopeptidase [Saprospiraceae bacterium]|nr:M23 family metallopeptidase [Saprospiraceae bacterium]
MKKEKFVYNPKSLTFERYRAPITRRMLQGISFLMAVVMTASGLLYLFMQYRPSPKEQSLMLEIDQMKIKYSSLNEQLNIMSAVLGNIQDRDASVHRMIFGMDPINKDVWNVGIGGHNRYSELTNYENSSDLLVNTLEKADKLARQMTIQSRSLDSLEYIASEKEKYINSIPSIKPVREDFVKRKITYLSGFGMRIHPIHKIPKMHTGLDFTANKGTLVRATGDGKITSIKKDQSGYGNHVMISHGYGYETLYGHLSKIEVHEGQTVKKGEIIGTVGSTGTSTAPHLHYEVHFKGQPINPIHYCMDGLTPKEYEEMVKMASEANKSFD